MVPRGPLLFRQPSLQLQNWSAGLVRFAEGDVESHHRRAIVVQRVEHAREFGARKRPAAQHFLRALVDVHDDDARIGMRIGCRPVAKAGVQRVQFQPIHKLKERRRPVADESIEIEECRAQW